MKRSALRLRSSGRDLHCMLEISPKSTLRKARWISLPRLGSRKAKWLMDLYVHCRLHAGTHLWLRQRTVRFRLIHDSLLLKRQVPRPEYSGHGPRLCRLTHQASYSSHPPVHWYSSPTTPIWTSLPSTFPPARRTTTDVTHYRLGSCTLSTHPHLASSLHFIMVPGRHLPRVAKGLGHIKDINLEGR